MWFWREKNRRSGSPGRGAILKIMNFCFGHFKIIVKQGYTESFKTQYRHHWWDKGVSILASDRIQNLVGMTIFWKSFLTFPKINKKLATTPRTNIIGGKKEMQQ